MGKAKRIRTNRKHSVEMQEVRPERLWGVETSGYYFLKIIAVISMFLWYFSFAFYLPLEIPDKAFYYMQMLGHISYPLLAYLVTESYFHTTNKLRHLVIMFVITIASEMPYDLIVFDRKFEPEMQSPAGSLTFAFLALCLTNINYKNALKVFYKSETTRAIVSLSLKVILLGLCGVLCVVLNTEFEWKGILLVFIFSKCRKTKLRMLIQLFAVAVFVELTMKISLMNLAYFFALIPIWLMQLKRSYPNRFVKIKQLEFIPKICSSRPMKYTARYFYPVMLWGMCLALYFLKK